MNTLTEISIAQNNAEVAASVKYMKVFFVSFEDYGCGDYGCAGATHKWLIAAHSKEEALSLLKPIESYEQNKYEIVELVLPELHRKRKPFIIL